MQQNTSKKSYEIIIIYDMYHGIFEFEIVVLMLFPEIVTLLL